jgi:hypothetical protein
MEEGEGGSRVAEDPEGEAASGNPFGGYNHYGKKEKRE